MSLELCPESPVEHDQIPSFRTMRAIEVMDDPRTTGLPAATGMIGGVVGGILGSVAVRAFANGLLG
jgi:hypothetical protein